MSDRPSYEYAMEMRDEQIAKLKADHLAALAEKDGEIARGVLREKILRDKWGKEVLELQAEINNPKKTYCAYCGYEVPIDDDGATKIGEHIHTCEKHPIHVYQAEISRLNQTISGKDDEMLEANRALARQQYDDLQLLAGRDNKITYLKGLLEEAEEVLREAAKMYDELAMSPLESACKYGDNYTPLTDEDLLEMRAALDEVIKRIATAQKEGV
jgi:hypothetical protein